MGELSPPKAGGKVPHGFAIAPNTKATTGIKS